MGGGKSLLGRPILKKLRRAQVSFISACLGFAVLCWMSFSMAADVSYVAREVVFDIPAQSADLALI